MPRLTTVQTNFASGEIDPKLRAQTSLQAYNQGAFRLRNLARLATGGVERRPGSFELDTLPGLTRIVEFEFSSDQRYIVAFYDEGATIFDLDGAVLDTIEDAPWTEADLFKLGYTQNGDTMIVSRSGEFTVRLVRQSYAVFTLEDFEFLMSADDLKLYQPYYKFAADELTLTPSAATGSITLEASAPVFDVGHNGLRLRIFDNEVEITAITDNDTATADVLGELKSKLDLDAFKSSAGSDVIEVLHPFHGFESGESVTFSGSNDIGHADDGTGGIAATDLDGARTITVIDEHRYTFQAGDTAVVGEDGGGPSISFSVAGVAVRDWKEPSISPVRGYPGAACFHEGRLWLAGTPSQPDGFFGSNALKPFRFDVGKGYDGESVQGAAGVESISIIRHLVSNGDLQMFTPTSEAVFVTRPGEAITPTNVRIVTASNSGCGYVVPQIFDGATLFVQENGLSVSELVYSSERGRYTATPVSTLASHLIADGVVDLAVSVGTTSRAEQYAFLPTGEGDIAVFHSMRAENIAGWALWTLGDGLVRSMAGTGNDVFLVVERDGDFFLYKLAQGDNFYSLDGAVEHTDDEPTTSWTLDARVRSRTMAMVCEHGYLGEVAVPANGIITTAVPCERLLVGDAFYYELETVTPKVDLPSGQRDRLVKRIVRAIIEFDEVVSAVVNGHAIELRQSGVDPSVAVEPYSGPYEFRVLGWDRNPTITITQQEPMFGRILGMTLEVMV